MRKNIVISATRQWNPGDEFILFGVMNILEDMGIEYNPILFNRSPEVRDGRKYSNLIKTKNIAQIIEKMHLLRLIKIGFRDNSYKNGTDSSIVDAVIFAGSPEWYGYRVKILYQLLKRKEIPYAFLGIGMGDSRNFNKLETMYYDVIRKCKLITTRDYQTLDMIRPYNANALHLTCPAMLASKTSKVVKKVNKIALIYATHETLYGNRVAKSTHDYMVHLYRKILKKYDNVGFVCHYIDEIEKVKKEFPNCDVYYSFDAKDYIHIYNEFDMVIGGRVHGIGMCASLGIPGIMISHDIRSQTVKGFHAQIITTKTEMKEAFRIISHAIDNIQEESLQLNTIKQEVMLEYKNLLKKSLHI